MSVKEMINREIEKLPENMLIEVYDFVRFLEIKKERETYVRTSQELSKPSFEKIWGNEEDSVYDNL